jgi:hypothetical protein
MKFIGTDFNVILSKAKDPYDETLEVVESQGFSPFRYDIVAPRACPEPVEGALRTTLIPHVQIENPLQN